MPITFDNEELFSSGPARVQIGGRTLRRAVEHPLSAESARLFSQGVGGRSITQSGMLIADTPDALQQQMAAIEAKLDGTPRTLVDHLERTWTQTVMLEFKPGQVLRLGTRWKVDYRIEYLQADA